MISRRPTRPVRVGSLTIGGDALISVQGMTKTDTRDAGATIDQIQALTEAGCELVRVAVPDREAARALERIRAHTRIPLAADIHFDYRLALEALEAGVDKLRLNPGNIGRREKVEEVARKAARMGVPIRIGVNAGSLEKGLLAAHGRTAAAMAASAMGHVEILEQLDFFDIMISLKASDVLTTIEAYRLLADRVDYPFHVGITEAGSVWSGTIKSSVGIGHLLALGIGDTIRVSLTGDPREEIRVGYEILAALGLRCHGPRIVSCPTCGRCEFDLVETVRQVEERLAGLQTPIRVAIMGCAVNGPGEALEADVGVAGGDGRAVLFAGGRRVGTVAIEELVDRVIELALQHAARESRTEVESGS